MASPPLVLPGVLFVGEDDRARIVAHTGPAAGWHVPRGILGWSTEVSVVGRDALTEDIRRSAKMVMPEEQIPPARMPLTAQAAQKSPLVAVSGRLVSKLVEAGIRVHTVGVDRVTSSFYYLAEGGGEDQIRIEGDLVQSVGAMLGERADNAAIERVLDGLPDRLLRALSKDRVSELTIELAAALPRAASDGSGTQELDLDGFEKALSVLVGSAEQYKKVAEEIASKLAETNERRVEVPLFGEARKVSQGPFDIAVGEGRVSLPTYERWVMSAPAGASASAPPPASAVKAPAQASKAATPAKPDAEDAMLANLETAESAAGAAAAKQAAADAAAAKKAAEDAEVRRKLEAAAAKADAEMKAEKEEAARKAAAAAKAEAELQAARDAKAAAEAKAAADAAAAKAAEEEKVAAEARAVREAAKAAEDKIAEAKAAEAAALAAEEATKKAAAKAIEDAKAAEAKAAEKKAFEAKKAEQKAARKGDSKRPDANAKKADDKKGDSAKAAADTLKIKKAGSSNALLWVALLVLAVGGVAFWRLYLNK